MNLHLIGWIFCFDRKSAYVIVFYYEIELLGNALENVCINKLV